MAVSAHGTLLKVGIAGSYTTIAEVRDISGPGAGFAVDPVYSDEPGGYPAMVPGLMTPGELSFDINYTGEASQAVIRNANTSQAVLDFQLVFTTEPSETYSFTGYVSNLEYQAPVDGVLRASLIITMAIHMVAS